MATEIRVDGQKINDDGSVFPYALGPANAEKSGIDDLCEWTRQNRHEISRRLLKHGAILVRGFDADKPEKFAAWIDSVGVNNMPYIGGAAVRTNIVGDVVFTANESPPSEPIPFHHEMSQVPQPPSHIYFYCEIPPPVGGQTPIVPSNDVFEALNTKFPDFAKKLEGGVRYRRVMSEEDDPTSALGRGWKSSFNTDSRAEAEAEMKKAGMEWKWRENGDVETITSLLPAVRVDDRTGKKMFFNSVVAAYTGWVDSRNVAEKAVMLSDGQYMDHDAMMFTANMMTQKAVAYTWQKGDMLFIDNRQMMHSRIPFEGKRRILASIGQDTTKVMDVPMAARL